jgi:hypothetical protein
VWAAAFGAENQQMLGIIASYQRLGAASEGVGREGVNFL